jgi:hypothetical protein
LSRIEPGANKDFDVEGSALEVVSHPGPPELFELRMVVTAESGFLRKKREFTVSSPPFRHWQSMGWSKPEATNESNTCFFNGTLYSGRMGVAKVYVVVFMPGKVDSLITSVSGSDFPSMHESATKASPSGAAQRQELTLDKLALYKSYDYAIRVNSQSASKEACFQLAQYPDLINFR